VGFFHDIFIIIICVFVIFIFVSWCHHLPAPIHNFLDASGSAIGMGVTHYRTICCPPTVAALLW
jgi:hypothetical protein